MKLLGNNRPRHARSGVPSRDVGAAVLLALLPAVAGAEEEPPIEVLDEITVTARRQETRIQEAPVAVTAVAGEELERSGVGKLDDFNGFAPGLTVTRNDGAGRVVSIRGVGWETAQNLSTQPGVLLYLDGVYLANPLALGLELGEIERVEIFRGPQGTEFGQSATGGAINIVTRAPRFDGAGGEVKLSVGTFGMFEVAASVDQPLGERLALRAAGRKLERGGFSEVAGGGLDGYELDDADALSGHLALEWIARPDLSLRLGVFGHSSEQGGAAQKSLADPNPDPRRLSQDFPGTFALDSTSVSLIVDWDMPRGGRLRSMTGWQRLRKRQTADGDRLTEGLVAVDLTGFGAANFDLLPVWDNDSDAFSQEINLSQRSERLDWTAGLYFLRHRNRNFFLEAIGPAPAERFAAQLADPSPETLPPGVPPLEFVEDRTLTREDSAVYGQLTYRLGERWALTAGGRLQRDWATDLTTQFWFDTSHRVLEDRAFTWKAGVDRRLGGSGLLYGLVSTGWRNGGGNPGAVRGGALDVPATFQAETVTAYELGWRSRLAAGRAQLGGALFHYDYRDYQFIQEDPVPFAAGTGNIPRVAIRGLEAELAWRLAPGWRLDGQLTALDGEIESELRTLDVVDFLESGFGRFTATGVEDRAGLRVDLAGNRPPKLPRLVGRLALAHERQLAGGGRFDVRLDWIHRGEFQYRVFNNPRVDTVPNYSTLGLHLAFEPAGRPLEISLRATNLFDEAGVNSRFTNPFGLHTTSEELIPPRQVVLTLRYRWGG